MDKKLSWRELKALNDIYEKRKSKAKIQKHPYINYLLKTKSLIGYRHANTKVLIPALRFDDFYQNNFLEQFQYYKDFLEQNGIATDACRSFKEEDIKTLIFISENKKELSQKLTNIEDFSSKIFEYGGSKYLKNRKGLKNAVCKILEIEEFPLQQKDHQWRLVIDCLNPKAIVLCENKSFLMQSWIAKKHKVKLWYVGGNNIRIVDDIDIEEFSKPIFYSCDWDLAGLQIYSRIKMKLRNRGVTIKLLYPNRPHNYMPVDSPYHKSFWQRMKDFTGLNKVDFTETEISLVDKLIKTNQWIEEESNDLILMLKNELSNLI